MCGIDTAITLYDGSSGRRRRRRHWYTVGGCGGVQSIRKPDEIKKWKNRRWRLITRYVRVAPVFCIIATYYYYYFIQEKHYTV